jgi:hypothetical protein
MVDVAVMLNFVRSKYLSALAVTLVLAALLPSSASAEGAPPLRLVARLLTVRTARLVGPSAVLPKVADDKAQPFVDDERPEALPRGLVASLPGGAIAAHALRAVAIGSGASLQIVPRLIEPGQVLAFSTGRAAGSAPLPLVVQAERADGKVAASWRVEATERWREHQLTLDQVTGEVISLVFRFDGAANHGAVALLGDVSVYSRDASLVAAESRPNVLVIWLDKVRAKFMSAHGAPDVILPNINALAAANVWFSQARSNGNHTAPVVLQTMQSVLLPLAYRRTEHQFLPTLAGELAAAGWYTASFGTHPYYGLAPRLDRPQIDAQFDLVTWNMKPQRGELDVRILQDDLTPWLRDQRREPFFVNVHFQGAHEPYPDISPDFQPPDWSTYLRWARGDVLEARHVWAAHRADLLVGQIIELLTRLNLRQKTLVVVLSDHGSTFGPDHRYFQWGYARMVQSSHPTDFYDEQLRIPLVAMHPSLTPGERTAPVTLLDLAPTLLELVHVPVPPQFEGRALAELWQKGTPPPPGPQFFACETERLYGVLDAPYKLVFAAEPRERYLVPASFVGKNRYYMVDKDDHDAFMADLAEWRRQGVPFGKKTIVREELFDLSRDPNEQTNKASSDPKRVARLRDLVQARVAFGSGPHALDTARHVVWVSSLRPATYRIDLEGSALVKLLGAHGACASFEAAQPAPDRISFTCATRAEPGGFAFLRRSDAALTVRVTRDGQPLGDHELFLGADGVALAPPQKAPWRLLPELMPDVSDQAPLIRPGRDQGVFLFRQPNVTRVEAKAIPELEAVFRDWGYAK